METIESELFNISCLMNHFNEFLSLRSGHNSKVFEFQLVSKKDIQVNQVVHAKLNREGFCFEALILSVDTHCLLMPFRVLGVRLLFYFYLQRYEKVLTYANILC